MIRQRKLSTFIALVLALGLFTAASAQSSAANNIILDKFDEKKATELTAHDPNTAPGSSSWSTENNDGNWEVYKGKAKELSEIPYPNSNDYRALINADNSDVNVDIKVKVYPNSDQFNGVVARYSGEFDWLMAFHDGVGDVILGKKRPDEDQNGLSTGDLGGFQELGRFAVDWSLGTKARTHHLAIEVVGPTIKVFADGDLVITANDDDGMSSSIVGMFSRGTGKNQFDEFKVTLAPTTGGNPSASPLTTSEGGSTGDDDDEEEDDDDDDDDDKKGKGKKDKKGKK